MEKLTPFLRVLGELGLISSTQEVIEHLHDRAGLPPPDPDAAKQLEEEPPPETTNKPKDEAQPGEPRNLPKNTDRQHQTPTTLGRPNK